MLKEYPVKGEKIRILDDNEFTRILMSYGQTKFHAKFIGGFCFSKSKKIYIRESRQTDMKLLNHERGHLRGYKHTWMPTLMNATWVFRWINKYWPPWGGQ